jgi:hypothetical protein
MSITLRTSTLFTHGPVMGAWVAACGHGEPFGTRITDKLSGI